MKLSIIMRAMPILLILAVTSCGRVSDGGFASQTGTVETQQVFTVAPPTAEPPLVEPPTSRPTTTPPPADTEGTTPHISFDGTSGQLASSTTQVIIPASPPAGNNPLLSPAYYQLDFQDFVVRTSQDSPDWRLPRLYIIAVADMQSFSDADYGHPQLTQLKQILLNKPELISEKMPVLPYSVNFNYAEAFHAKIQYVNFMNGSGVRFLAEYMQGISTVGRKTSYIFQGLTSDGKYYVSLTLPIASYTALDKLNFPYIDVDTNNGTWDVLSHNYDSYLTSAAAILETVPDSSFTPDLGQLDGLVQSLNVSP